MIISSFEIPALLRRKKLRKEEITFDGIDTVDRQQTVPCFIRSKIRTLMMKIIQQSAQFAYFAPLT